MNSISQNRSCHSRFPIKTYKLASLPNDFKPKDIANSPLEKRVQLIEKRGDSYTYLVDGCIYVTGPSQSLKEKNIRDLTSQKEGTIIMGIFAFFLMGFSIYQDPPTHLFQYIYRSIQVSVPLAASLVCVVENQKIHELLCAWNEDPAIRVANERKEAYRQGIVYAVNRNLKGIPRTTGENNILHPQEVVDLFEEKVKTMMQEVQMLKQSSSQFLTDEIDRIQSFLKEELFSQKTIQYVYGNEQTLLERWSSDFEAQRASLCSLDTLLRKIKEIKASAEEEQAQILEKKMHESHKSLPKKELKKIEEQVAHCIEKRKQKEEIEIQQIKNRQIDQIYKKYIFLKGLSTYLKHFIGQVAP